MRRGVVTLLASALLLAGCGGEGGDRLSRAEYQAEVSAVGETLGGALSGVDASGGDLNAIRGQVEQLQEALRTAAADLDELSPPEDASAAHDKLVEGIRGFADDLDELSESLESGDLGAAASFQQTFTQSESVAKIREAAEELQAKGYSLE